MDIERIEVRRLEIQKRLDTAKTQAERNVLGQFATPNRLAEAMLNDAKQRFPANQPIRFLDPALGTGSFYSALMRSFSSSQIDRAVGYEIDPTYASQAFTLWHTTSLETYIADFTNVAPPVQEADKFNLVICNPPYVRHHHLHRDDKLRLRQRAKQTTGLEFNGLSGLYAYFLAITHQWMAADGLAGWLIPGEFLDVAYGTKVKAYLLKQVTTLSIHRFGVQDVQFDDALVSSAIVWFRNSSPPAKHTIQFTYGDNLSAPKMAHELPAEQLKPDTKWNFAQLNKPKLSPASQSIHSDGQTAKLSDYFSIKRGIATGNNKFFILNEQQIHEYQLHANFLTPILPSPRYLPNDVIDKDDSGYPVLERKLFLVDCSLPEKVIEAEYPTLWAYLQKGEAEKIHQAYLCRHRTPWYKQENRPPAPILCNYMGRKSKTNSNPFRFILNRSCATAPNVYLMLYPKPQLQEIFHVQPELVENIWRVLSETARDYIPDNGRSYGGGLHKAEPKELGTIPVSEVERLLLDYLPQKLF
jgi:predicted RNA methylase